MIALTIWTACTASAPPEEPAPQPVDPLPWNFGGPTSSDEVDLDAVGEALSRAANEALAYDARPIVDAYLARLDASATGDCPDETVDQDGNRYWLSGCIADDGTAFGGFLFHSPVTDQNDGTFVFSGDTVNGNARIERGPESLDIQGAATYLTGTTLDESADIVVTSVSGGFALDPAPAGWLAEGPQSAEIQLAWIDFREFPGTIVQVGGSMVTTLPSGTWATVFAGTTMASGTLSECDLEPGGVVDVRDPG
ncbi:MAG: hypothetical protein AAF211_24415, partial [Myxococcota bacterium]